LNAYSRGVLASAAALAALLAAPPGGTTTSAGRVIDYTAVCRMLGEGYPDATQFMTVSASNFPPAISVSNGPRREVRVQAVTGPSGREQHGSLVVNRAECAPSTFRMRFSTKGLGEVRPTQLPRSQTCDVPASVLVRVRATFTRPTGFKRDPRTSALVRAGGRIASAYLAVTTLRGRRPIAYASANGTSGRTRLLVAAARCSPDRP
jgi:hypothetical protein